MCDALPAVSLHDALSTLSAFTRALGHKIRTPLAVVSNELSYLHSTQPGPELAQALQRCREISDILKGICLPVDSCGADHFPISELVDTHNVLDGVSVEIIGEPLVRGNRARLKLVYRELFGLIASAHASKVEDSVKSSSLKLSRVRIESNAGQVLTSFESMPPPNAPSGYWSSFSAFWCDSCGCDFVSAPLIDMLVWGDAGRVSIQNASTLRSVVTLRAA